MTLENIPLTIIILTHRADERFRQSLASAQPAAEILIGDYQSENNWQKLKKDFKFKKIGRSVPINNFAAERNHFLKQAKHDWVLFLDSDEVITENSWPTISKIVKQNKIKGVFVRRQDVFYGKKLKFGETGNNWLLRLMRKDQAKFIRPVHEVVETTGLTKKSAIVLEHFAHQNVNEFFRDISRYAMIQAEYQQDHQQIGRAHV